MSTACLNGLTAAYRQQVVATNTVDFTKLRPQDVERLVPTNQLDIDWSAVIFIKNCRRRKAVADTVVWTEQDGFYRTRQSPRALINQLVEMSLVQWLDMRAMVDYLQLSGPLPYVMGRIMLVSTERPADGNQTSWVGCWSVSHMNPTTRQHQVSLLLTNGMTMIIRDTVSRLRKKVAEAHQILVFQQANQAYATYQYQPISNAYRPFNQEPLAFRRYRDWRLVSGVLRKAGYSLPDEVVKQLVTEIYRGDWHPRHLDDEWVSSQY